MDKTPFEDFDFSSFWANNEYAQKYYIGTIPTDKQVEEIDVNWDINYLNLILR